MTPAKQGIRVTVTNGAKYMVSQRYAKIVRSLNTKYQAQGYGYWALETNVATPNHQQITFYGMGRAMRSIPVMSDPRNGNRS